MTDRTCSQEHDARWGPLCELYVMNALDESQYKSFEQHAVSCQTCAQMLQREAEFELSLIELATHARRRIRARTSFSNRAPFAVAAGLAACLALVFATFKLHEPTVGAQRAVIPARGKSLASGREFDLIVAFDRSAGAPGRAIAESGESP